jgi:L-alanine-DL-glutamate epimerase-like enolase superfamily enzyme
MEHGISMALHMAGSPVTLFSSVHCAAATENFLVMEHHNVDNDWYDKLVTGPEMPLVASDGFIPVPETPGLGVELNEDEIRKHLREGEGYFDPTPEWDDERAWDRLWSFNGATPLPATRRRS